MTGPNEATPEFKDRTVGLIVFGGVSVLIGIFCALLIPLMFLSMALSDSVVGGGVNSRSAWSASALYGLMAVAFVWLGIGSIRARRWASELLLSLSWIWLLTGVCSLIIGMLVIPAVFRVSGVATGIPSGMVSLVVLVIVGVIGLFYVALPGAFLLFYRSPHVAATCRVRHPDPQWIDDCPPKLLTLMVVWALAAVSVFLMPGYDFIFPLFGMVLTGTSGAVLWILVLAACVVLAVGTCKQASWAWWGGVVLTVAAALSSSLVAFRYDLAEITALMDLPEEQVSMIAALGLPDGWPMALINTVVWGTFFVYLMNLRRFFEPVAADD